jgi:hypothetical protein
VDHSEESFGGHGECLSILPTRDVVKRLVFLLGEQRVGGQSESRRERKRFQRGV